MIGQTPSTTFPIVIDTPGSYVLTSNLQVATIFSCIQITTDNVTLDLNGFALIGPETGTGGYGIFVDNSNNITIMNGTVRDFRNSGIYILSGTKIQLKDLKCTNNGQYGINVRYATVVNCVAEDNGTDGINARYSTVRDCTSNNNTDDGIDVANSTVLNCQAFSNDNRGIYSRFSTITNCSVTGNVSHGIEATNSVVNNCTSNGHTNTYSFKYGIQLTDSLSTNCTANGNDWGFHLDNSTVTNCTAINNVSQGIHSTNSTVTSCSSDGNYVGIVAWISTITNCNVHNSGFTGIVVYGLSRIEGNNVRTNGQLIEDGYGIDLSNWVGDGDNYVIKNSASDNYSGNFHDGSTNNYMPLTGDNANYGF